jgi:predicted HTH domain antitoxin
MTKHTITITYTEELLVSLKETPSQFEKQAKILLAVKLYELGKVTTGNAAKIAGLSRIEFLFTLAQFSVSPMGIEPDELEGDWKNA